MKTVIRHYPLTDYVSAWQKMQQFTRDRTSDTPDEIWMTEHFPVYTQGQRGGMQHVLDVGNIPIIQTDRGGQVTYHGPGQLVVYVLLDIQRRALSIRNLVTLLEQSVIALLAEYNILATSYCHAPGVYVDEAKICSLGLRVRKGCCYHGLALNVDMDLAPFLGIHPCGYQGLKMTQMIEHVKGVKFEAAKKCLEKHLLAALERT